MKNLNLHFIYLIVILSGCAQFVAPTGGKKDEKPPILINSFPKNDKSYLLHQK